MPIKFFIFALGLLVSLKSIANEITVFEVEKSIPLSNDEIVYKDYYLNGGATQGVKKGMVLGVFRKTPIHDNLKNKSQGFLMNPIGRLQVIHVEQEFSVARLFSLNERETLPVAEIEGVMIGDIADLSTALEIKGSDEMKPRKKSAKKEEKVEEKADQSSVAEKVKPAVQLQASPAPVTIAPPAIGLPKAPAVDKPSL